MNSKHNSHRKIFPVGSRFTNLYRKVDKKNLECYALLNFIFNTFLKVSFKKNTILLPKDFNDGTLRNLFWPCSKLSGARSSGYVKKGELGGHQTLLSYKSWPLMAFGCVRYEGHN